MSFILKLFSRLTKRPVFSASHYNSLNSHSADTFDEIRKDIKRLQEKEPLLVPAGTVVSVTKLTITSGRQFIGSFLIDKRLRVRWYPGALPENLSKAFHTSTLTTPSS